MNTDNLEELINLDPDENFESDFSDLENDQHDFDSGESDKDF